MIGDKLTNVKRIKASELYEYIKKVKSYSEIKSFSDLFSMNFWVFEPTDCDSAWGIEQNWCDPGLIEFNLGGCGEAYRWPVEQMNQARCVDLVNILVKEDEEERVDWIDEEHTECWVWVETVEE